MSLPNKLQEIVNDFSAMTREEKLETLIGYAETFPPLPDRYKEQRERMETVPECMTPVFWSLRNSPMIRSFFSSTFRRNRPLCADWHRFFTTG